MFQNFFSNTNVKSKRFFFFMFFGLMFMLAIPLVLMWLWNSSIPEVTHFTPINYKQSLSLFILCRLLFGGFRFGGRHRRDFGERVDDRKRKWQNMSDEERAQFKEAWKKRCEDRKN